MEINPYANDMKAILNKEFPMKFVELLNFVDEEDKYILHLSIKFFGSILASNNIEFINFFLSSIVSNLIFSFIIVFIFSNI